MSFMSNLAIITARGGSKRIPRKNVRDFCGRPILVYSIEAASQSGLFDEIMVSTDDAEIAAIARCYGAAVPFMRSSKTSNDYATTEEVLHEVLDEYGKRGKKFKWTCCIYPTAPFVTADKLRKAFQYLQEQRGDALTPVVKFSYPPQRCFVIKNGCLSYKWPEHKWTRSQDLEPLYHDVGQFYFWDTKKFLAGTVACNIPYKLGTMEVQDIDSPEDWELAELKYRRLYML